MEETRQAEGQIEAAGTQTGGWGCPDPQGGRAAARGGTRRGSCVRRRGSAPAPPRRGAGLSLPPRVGAGPGRRGRRGRRLPGNSRRVCQRARLRRPCGPLGPLGPLGCLARRAGFPRGRGGARRGPCQEPGSLHSLLISAPRGSPLPRGRRGEGRHRRTRTGEGTPPALDARARREFSSAWGSGPSLPDRQMRSPRSWPSSCFCADLSVSWGRRMNLQRESQLGFDFRIWKMGTRAVPTSQSTVQIEDTTASAASARDGVLPGNPGSRPAPGRVGAGTQDTHPPRPGSLGGCLEPLRAAHTEVSPRPRPAPALLCQRPRQAPARSGPRGEGGCAPAPTGTRPGSEGAGAALGGGSGWRRRGAAAGPGAERVGELGTVGPGSGSRPGEGRAGGAGSLGTRSRGGGCARPEPGAPAAGRPAPPRAPGRRSPVSLRGKR